MIPTIVAEIGAAHNGKFERAMALVDAAARAGADAVKIQCWFEMALPGHIIADGPWKGRDLAALYMEARMPLQWHIPLRDRARALGLDVFASVFDKASVDLCKWGSMYKIASAEIVDLPLIAYAASKGKPMVISTGMATWEEILHAASVCRSVKTTLLKCVSAYPASTDDANLATMVAMRALRPVGLSDHTFGSAVACAATALGATMIEKHIGLDRTGLDGGFCTLPEDFRKFVRDVRDAAASLGEVRYGPLPSEASTLALRRSLWVVKDVRAGDAITEENVRSLRPAGGLPPDAPGVFGGVFAKDAKSGQPFTADL